MKIEKCPFCDKDVAEISNCQELEGCRHFEKCPATEPYVCVVCNMHEGGCGASSGYYDSEAKAIAAWNGRADDERLKNALKEIVQLACESVEREKVLARLEAEVMAAIEPAVRGEWKLYGNDDDSGMSYWCTACNFQLSEDLFYSGYKNGRWIENRVFKYCPNCGAKMESEGST